MTTTQEYLYKIHMFDTTVIEKTAANAEERLDIDKRLRYKIEYVLQKHLEPQKKAECKHDHEVYTDLKRNIQQCRMCWTEWDSDGKEIEPQQEDKKIDKMKPLVKYNTDLQLYILEIINKQNQIIDFINNQSNG